MVEKIKGNNPEQQKNPVTDDEILDYLISLDANSETGLRGINKKKMRKDLGVSNDRVEGFLRDLGFDEPDRGRFWADPHYENVQEARQQEAENLQAGRQDVVDVLSQIASSRVSEAVDAQDPGYGDSIDERDLDYDRIMQGRSGEDLDLPEDIVEPQELNEDSELEDEPVEEVRMTVDQALDIAKRNRLAREKEERRLNRNYRSEKRRAQAAEEREALEKASSKKTDQEVAIERKRQENIQDFIAEQDIVRDAPENIAKMQAALQRIESTIRSEKPKPKQLAEAASLLNAVREANDQMKDNVRMLESSERSWSSGKAAELKLKESTFEISERIDRVAESAEALEQEMNASNKRIGRRVLRALTSLMATS